MDVVVAVGISIHDSISDGRDIEHNSYRGFIDDISKVD
jgi:hypothetical protein